MSTSKNKDLWNEDKDITFTDEDVEKIPDQRTCAGSKEIYDLKDDDLGFVNGEKVDIATVLNRPIVVTGLSFQPSQFYDGDYAKVSLDDGTFFTTSSSVLMDDLRSFKNRLPMRCMILTKKGKQGRNYYYLAGSDHR